MVHVGSSAYVSSPIVLFRATFEAIDCLYIDNYSRPYLQRAVAAIP